MWRALAGKALTLRTHTDRVGSEAAEVRKRDSSRTGTGQLVKVNDAREKPGRSWNSFSHERTSQATRFRQIGHRHLRGLDPSSTASAYSGSIRVRVLPARGHLWSARRAARSRPRLKETRRTGTRSSVISACPTSPGAPARPGWLAQASRCTPSRTLSATPPLRPPADTCTPTTAIVHQPESRRTPSSPTQPRPPVRRAARLRGLCRSRSAFSPLDAGPLSTDCAF